jgi:hypothetical protein
MTLARRCALYLIALSCAGRAEKLLERADRQAKRVDRARAAFDRENAALRSIMGELRAAQDRSIVATREYARAADLAEWEGYEEACAAADET